MIIVSHRYEVCSTHNKDCPTHVELNTALVKAAAFAEECNALDKEALLSKIRSILNDASFKKSPVRYMRECKTASDDIIKQTAAQFINRCLLNVYH